MTKITNLSELEAKGKVEVGDILVYKDKEYIIKKNDYGYVYSPRICDTYDDMDRRLIKAFCMSHEDLYTKIKELYKEESKSNSNITQNNMSKKYRLKKDIKSHQIFPKGLSYLKSNDMIVDFLFDNHFSEYFEEIKEEYTFMYYMDKNLKKGDIIVFYKNMSKEEMFDSIFMKGEKKDLKY